MSSPAELITADSGLIGSLPKDFLLGAASASHQIEGCIDADGKGEGLWDNILSDKKGDNGEDACNSYEQWRDDIALVQDYGFNCYRFSISWPRIIPHGGRNDPINKEGVEYYSDLVDALLARNITPVVTIFHWDHPQALEDRYQGFYNEQEIVADFVNYSKVLFERLGDRVKHWITINEPHIFTMRLSMLWGRERFDVHNDYTRLARTLTLCHAQTVDLYRRAYQPSQNGQIGITLNTDWTEPLDDSPEAKHTAELSMQLILGLYADPIFADDFSQGLKEEYGDRLPRFSDEEKKLIQGSSDFFGLNHYCTAWTTGKRYSVQEAGPPGWLWSFGRTEKVHEKNGVPIGTAGLGGHLCSVPWGLRKTLVYIHKHYTKASGIPIWITENGFPVDGEAEMPLEERIEDTPRQEYYAGYLKAMMEAIQIDGVKMGGYMAWSLLDNLEWERGYAPRFGLTVVDKANGFKRHPKKSAYMLRDIYRHLLGN